MPTPFLKQRRLLNPERGDSILAGRRKPPERMSRLVIAPKGRKIPQITYGTGLVLYSVSGFQVFKLGVLCGKVMFFEIGVIGEICGFFI